MGVICDHEFRHVITYTTESSL